MFTGIVTETAKVKKIEGSKLTLIASENICRKLAERISIAANGVCLTVIEKADSNSFCVEIIPETLKKSMLGNLQTEDLVNLELPVTPTDFLSGHIVQGHVDGIGEIANITEEGNSRVLTVNFPENLAKYIVEKGSIAINGVALTIISVDTKKLTVGIIPYTFTHTMFYNLTAGDKVNIEVDILAKYVEKLL